MADYHEIGSMFSKELNLPNDVEKKWTRYRTEQQPPAFNQTDYYRFNFVNEAGKF